MKLAAAAEEPNHRILVIDDNRAIHDDIRKILIGSLDPPPELELEEAMLFGDTPEDGPDFSIDSAYQGQEGLAMVEASIAKGCPYALAFVDIRMPPGWDGVETIERLWRVSPGLQVVVCTAYSDYSWSEIRRRLGQSDNLLILKKPFDNIEVTQLAYALTKKWQVSRDASARMEDLDLRIAERTRQLQRAEVAFRVVFEASPIGISLSDVEGRYLRVNEAFAALAGMAPEQLLGKTPIDLGWVADHAALEEIERQLTSFGHVDAQEVAYHHPSRGQRTGLLWLRAVTIDHAPHILSFFLDITDRKEMEEELRRARFGAEAAARAKSEFLANMSHEIRTPLNGVLGLTSLLEEKDMPDDAHAMLRLIRASGETLAKILDDVLDYSKIECGKLELERAPFSLRESLEWAVELFRPKADEKHLELSLSIDTDLADRLSGDATRIRQVLANLISNAIKFTEQGSIRVHAGFAPGSAAGENRKIRVSVRDTGIGIPAEKADRLFCAFSQVDPSTNRRFGGSGLGLAICRRLVELMGGSIHVNSRAGEGSEFAFEFVANPAAPVVAEPDDFHATIDTARLRILLVEDNRVNQIVAERMLERLGCHPDLACDGGAAVEKLEQSHYDLVFLDVQMPGVDGIEATRRIRAGAGQSARVPIVALTASATLEDRRECLAAGMDDYLSKPVTLEALRGAIRRWGAGAARTGSQTTAPASLSLTVAD
jgi:PAS domain S-box-containing protein